MAETLLTNPVGAFRTVSDFRTGRDASGFKLDFASTEILGDGIANGAIAVGDIVVRVVPTATQGLRYAKGGATPGGWTVAGVALSKAAAAGNAVQIATRGFALVNVGAGTPAAGDVATVGATAGQAGVIVAGTGVAATDVAGSILGEFLGAKNADNLAPVWIDRF
jgi:hypothetical protein